MLFLIGIIFLPLTGKIFNNFFDRGYAFSKILGILLISYFVWLSGSLKILSFSVPHIFLIILIFFLISLYLAFRNRKSLLPDLRSCWKIFLFEEILFFLCLAFWSFIRGFQPDINGLEKFMDFGFVNSLLRSQYFPPLDLWMSGKTINYYYFGHLVAAILTKISGINSAITYNLMIATIFSLAFSATFSLGANLMHFFSASKKFRVSVFAGFLSATLLTLGGNLHSLYWFLTHNFSFTGYWYPDATRFIVEKFGAMDNTIHEFPLYSFVVSDLHGHVSDIPFVLLFLAFLLSFFSSQFNLKLLLPALTLAVMYMTNSWDFPIYFMVLGLVILWKNYQEFGSTIKTFTNTLLFVVCTFFLAIFFSLPFHLHFSQIAQGIALVHAHTPLWMLPVLWGFPWWLIIIFLILKFLNLKTLKIDYKLQIINYKLFTSDIFILILISIATLLIIIPEFLYVKDIYIASYHRANTMFKLVYQSFMLYSIASGYIIVNVLTNLRNRILKFSLLASCFLLLSFVLAYPQFAINSYYGDLKNYQSLAGLKFLQSTNPDNLAVINWLNQNVTGQPTILEAVGDSYTEFNQISMATGLPTVEGWLVHEWLWRGSFDEPGKRASEVQLIYETQDLKTAETYLQKYQVKYVIVGNQEREKYKVSEDKFLKLGKIIFQSGNTKIYQID